MVEPRVSVALDRVDAELAKGSPYETVMAALAEAERMEGNDEAAYAIAQTRFTIALVYDRPVDELEAALRARLALETDPVRRTRATGAAYATYPGLKPYFDAAVTELEAAPPTPVIERALESAARVRARMEAMNEENTANAGPGVESS